MKKSVSESQKPKAILVEDTEIMNSLYSLILDQFVESQLPLHTIIFWKSPGFEWSKNDRLPILSLSPQYTFNNSNLSDKAPISVIGIEKHLESSLIDTSSKIYRHFGNQEYISLASLCAFSYKNSRVGQAAASMLLRINDAVSISRNVRLGEATAHLFNICRAIDTLEHLNDVFDIEYLFLSESVYYSYALVDFAISCSITAPYFLTYEGPIFINRSHLCKTGEIGPSPRQKATLQITSNASVNEVGRLQEQLASRVAGSATYNQTFSHDLDEIDVSCSDIASAAGFTYAMDSRELLAACNNNMTAIIYLHAATDGMYLRGYSGYPTPIDFFHDVCKRLLECMNGHINIVVRPHPNILAGRNSAYTSHRDKALKEFSILREHILEINDLVCSYRPSSMVISSARMGLDALFSLRNSVHVSHHGTILSDAYAFRLKTIGSYVSPLSSLEDQDNCLFVKPSTTMETFRNYLLNGWCSASIDKGRLMSAAKLVPYNYSYYKNLLGPLSRIPYSESIHSLNQHIYQMGLSWRFCDYITKFPDSRPMLEHMLQLIKDSHQYTINK